MSVMHFDLHSERALKMYADAAFFPAVELCNKGEGL